MVSSAIIYLLFVFIFIYFILFLFVMNIVACEDKFSLVGSKTPARGEHHCRMNQDKSKQCFIIKSVFICLHLNLDRTILKMHVHDSGNEVQMSTSSYPSQYVCHLCFKSTQPLVIVASQPWLEMETISSPAV